MHHTHLGAIIGVGFLLVQGCGRRFGLRDNILSYDESFEKVRFEYVVA